MSLEPEFVAMMSQAFTVEDLPAVADPDTYQGPGAWQPVGTIYGHLRTLRNPAEPTDETGTRNTDIHRWRLYARPDARYPDGGTTTAGAVLTRTRRLTGPDGASTAYSIHRVAPRYDEDGVHHYEVELSEIT